MSSPQSPSDDEKNPKLGLGQTFNVKAREPVPLDVGKMKDQVRNCVKNIERFTEAIRCERAMIDDLQGKIVKRELAEADTENWKIQDPDTKEWHDVKVM